MYLSPTGPILLYKKPFLARCNSILAANGLGRITGHCFRIGGTTELLMVGVHPDAVKKLGRWKSDAFLRYWRKDQDLAERMAARSRWHRT
jgi:hypothetical protein